MRLDLMSKSLNYQVCFCPQYPLEIHLYFNSKYLESVLINKVQIILITLK